MWGITTAGRQPSRSLVLLLLLCASILGFPTEASIRAPLPLDVSVDPQLYVDYDVAPNGLWVAYTTASDSRRSRASAWIENSGTGDRYRLGIDTQSSWTPTWSHDGRLVAYYSCQDGELGLWIWTRDGQGRAHTYRVSALEVPLTAVTGALRPSWLADGRHLFTTVVSDGQHSKCTSNQVSQPSLGLEGGGVHATSVLVFRTGQVHEDEHAQERAVDLGWMRRQSDLALIDITTGNIDRIARRLDLSSYVPSPDGRYVAYTVRRGYEPNSQQGLHDVIVQDLRTGSLRTVGNAVPMQFGRAVSWSAEGGYLAYRTEGPSTPDKIVIALPSKSPDPITNYLVSSVTSAANFEQAQAPLWESRGTHLLTIVHGEIVRVDAKDGKASTVAQLPGEQGEKILGYFSSSGAPTRDSLLVSSTDDETLETALYQVNLATGAISELSKGYRSYSIAGSANIAHPNVTAVAMADAQHPTDLYLIDSKTRRSHRVTHSGDWIGDIELGTPRIVHWIDLNGEPRRGSLILPPGYAKNSRVPLVSWIYGGESGAAAISSFGLVPAAVFNLQMLATRGYAVFFPDTPQHEGTQAMDLVRTVLPGINSLIEHGYVDADRLAVMGHSYGAHCVLALLSQSDRFKAAEVTGVPDPALLASYLSFGLDGSDGTAYHEHGQGGMGGTLWEYPQRYLANAPVFALDRVNTAILIGQGMSDPTTPMQYASSVFVALRRLGKNVEYRLYANERHVIEKPENVLDFWKRRLEFFSERLNIATDQAGAVVLRDGRAKPRS